MTEWLAWLDSVRGQPPAVSLANDAERVRIPTSDVIGRHLEERPMSFVELREARVRRGDIKMRILGSAASESFEKRVQVIEMFQYLKHADDVEALASVAC